MSAKRLSCPIAWVPEYNVKVFLHDTTEINWKMEDLSENLV
jgi:hypothetical protein